MFQSYDSKSDHPLRDSGASGSPDRRLFWALCALVFLVTLALTALTPMVSDDFAYCFSWNKVRVIVNLMQLWYQYSAAPSVNICH